MRQYHEPGFVSHAARVSDDVYQVVLDNVVVCCVDCVVIHGGKMLLGLRTQHPYKGWWVMGGRMKPGESYEATACRVVEREAGLHIEDLRRFYYIDTACYIWEHREQEPQDHGCHMEGNNFYVVISDEEAARIKDSGDFSELRWVDLAEVIEHSWYHPSIQFFAQFVRDFLDPV